MKIWVDDIRPAPVKGGYIWCMSTNKAIEKISECGRGETLILDLDHDAGNFFYDGGDYIKLLDWLEVYNVEKKLDIKVHIHSMNPVGRQNMERICKRNGWEVLM